MDENVKQAMVKWPNVPHCYGWLALDARGAWRMRDERAQALGLPGDKITHPALLGFINRNYTHDNHGCWYFQNGPQRVYVNLTATPYIARTDPAQGFMLHTGEPLGMPDNAWVTEAGLLIVEGNQKVAQVDDRDMDEYLTHLQIDGNPVGDEQLLAWLSDAGSPGKLTLNMAGRHVSVKRLAAANIATHFRFDAEPKE
ncbi:MAG: DUF2946 family protein [Burkholderiales bacterium]